jgi:two-component system sensor histidine kinase ChvG
MAIEAEISKPALAAKPLRRAGIPFLRRVIVPLRRGVGHYVFSSLTRRILFLNLAALAVLAVGILYLSQFRDGLIEARIESLMTQGEIIAGAIASSATVETDSIIIDPEKLLELQAGESLPAGSDQLDSLDFPINPERVAPLLRRLISPTRTRARIYDRDANLLLDSRHLYSQGQILRYDLPPVDDEDKGYCRVVGKEAVRPFPAAPTIPSIGSSPAAMASAFPEVVSALVRQPVDHGARQSEQGEQIVSVAVPIQRIRAPCSAF